MARVVAVLSVLSRWKMMLPLCSTAHRPSILMFARPSSSARFARLPLLCGTTIVKSYACMTRLLCRAPSISAGPQPTVRALSHDMQPLRSTQWRRTTHTGRNPWHDVQYSTGVILDTERHVLFSHLPTE